MCYATARDFVVWRVSHGVLITALTIANNILLTKTPLFKMIGEVAALQGLTHWFLADLDATLNMWLSIVLLCSDLLMTMPLEECFRVCLLLVDIGSGKGLVPSGNNLLLEQMLSHR